MSDSNTRRKYKGFFRISIQKYALVLAFFLAPGLPAGADTLLTEFSKLPVGSVPRKGWEARGGEAEGVYRIEAEGESRFLRAVDKGQSVQIFRDVNWPIRKEPVLKWRWRVHEFPAGSDERAGETNDSAAAIYVIFPRVWFVPEIIKYVWSRVVPKDTQLRRSARYTMIVIRSGETPLDTWVEESRNVAEDFEKIFGRKAPEPLAIGFLTDANAVKKSASADYGELESTRSQ
jgi:hypothetical protein